jgi:hypothetical protein
MQKEMLALLLWGGYDFVYELRTGCHALIMSLVMLNINFFHLTIIFFRQWKIILPSTSSLSLIHRYEKELSHTTVCSDQS